MFMRFTLPEILCNRYICRMNYFELFELPVAPEVDKSVLAKKYFELQKKFHPDFFTNETDEEKETVLQQSADINKAYKIFQSRDKTIEYFLQQKNIIATDEKYTLPPDFLMEMMELNEGLSESEPVQTENKVSVYEAGLQEDIQPVLMNYDEQLTTDAELQKLKAFYYKKKYLNRILERLGD